MKNQKLDKLLVRQLNKCGLSLEIMPRNLDEWQTFIYTINRSYNQTVQDRYLLERSLQLASKEMKELNDKVENVQRVAMLGYWSYDIESGKIFWSKEIYTLFGFNYTDEVPSYDEMIKKYIHPEDWERLNNTVQKAIMSGKDYEIEGRVIDKKTKKCKWFYAKGHPHKEGKKNGKYQLLSGIVLDITKRKESEIKIAELNQQLIFSARKAGMAEMATSVLHNIGNVLNSVNVSSSLLLENVDYNRITQLEKAVDMLYEHAKNFEDFMLNDSKGKLLPQYFDISFNEIKDEYQMLHDEIKNINKYSEHMRDIIKKQQSLAVVNSFTEEFEIKDLIDDAIQLSLGTLNKYKIDINIDINKRVSITCEKHKLLQILVNLIRNAVDSISMAEKLNQPIDIAIHIARDDMQIKIKDYGIGISKDNIEKIFNFGYTTKKDGHGYGLHNSAIIATELGGRLIAESDGLNKGAVFILQIPIKVNSEDYS